MDERGIEAIVEGLKRKRSPTYIVQLDTAMVQRRQEHEGIGVDLNCLQAVPFWQLRECLAPVRHPCPTRAIPRTRTPHTPRVESRGAMGVLVHAPPRACP